MRSGFSSENWLGDLNAQLVLVTITSSVPSIEETEKSIKKPKNVDARFGRSAKTIGEYWKAFCPTTPK